MSYLTPAPPDRLCPVCGAVRRGAVPALLLLPLPAARVPGSAAHAHSWAPQERRRVTDRQRPVQAGGLGRSRRAGEGGEAEPGDRQDALVGIRGRSHFLDRWVIGNKYVNELSDDYEDANESISAYRLGGNHCVNISTGFLGVPAGALCGAEQLSVVF